MPPYPARAGDLRCQPPLGVGFVSAIAGSAACPQDHPTWESGKCGANTFFYPPAALLCLFLPSLALSFLPFWLIPPSAPMAFWLKG